MRRRTAALVVVVALAAAAVLGVAQTRTFPGPPTDTNPRANTPNDPDFDKAEPDDEDGDFVPGTSVFEEDNRLFGFAPASTSMTARYLDPAERNALAVYFTPPLDRESWIRRNVFESFELDRAGNIISSGDVGEAGGPAAVMG